MGAQMVKEVYSKTSDTAGDGTTTATVLVQAILRDVGFTKLVRRDDGVYENVTRRKGDSRYMEQGKPNTIPNIRNIIFD
nr:hypothetical protein [uncultured Desulfobacter sp.]